MSYPLKHCLTTRTSFQHKAESQQGKQLVGRLSRLSQLTLAHRQQTLPRLNSFVIMSCLSDVVIRTKSGPGKVTSIVRNQRFSFVKQNYKVASIQKLSQVLKTETKCSSEHIKLVLFPSTVKSYSIKQCRHRNWCCFIGMVRFLRGLSFLFSQWRQIH